MSGQTTRMDGISFTIPTGHEIDPEKVYRMWVDFFERHAVSPIVLPIGAKVEVLPDPRIARDRARAEIDAVLREDARRFPAFATARMAAVVAACERPTPPPVEEVRVALAAFHAYENARGGMHVDTSDRAPFTDAWRLLRDMGQDISIPVAGTCWRHYERNRGAR